MCSIHGTFSRLGNGNCEGNGGRDQMMPLVDALMGIFWKGTGGRERLSAKQSEGGGGGRLGAFSAFVFGAAALPSFSFPFVPLLFN